MSGNMKRVCRDYMNEDCKYGAKCKYIHDDHLCYDFWDGDQCESDANKCRFNHYVKRDTTTTTTTAATAAVDKSGLSPSTSKKELGGKGDRKERSTAGGRNGTTTPSNLSHNKPKAIFEKGGGNKRGGKKKNTENFDPSHEPATMRLQVDISADKISVPLSVRDVTLHPCMFKRKGDANIYDRLVKEMKECSIAERDLLKSWHGDSHWIADDKTGWKKQCPTFTMVVERLRTYFAMDIKATRFNWYKDQSEWKPYHHDAAAVKPDKARTQNFTVGVSFGCTRDAAFEEVESKKTIAIPQPDGMVYTFARDVNVMWKHGILQVPPKQQKEEGRISIIAWGWIDQWEESVPGEERKLMTFGK